MQKDNLKNETHTDANNVLAVRASPIFRSPKFKLKKNEN